MKANSHHATGRQLHDMREQLLDLKLPYPTSHPAHRRLRKAIKTIDELRNVLDCQFDKEAGDDFDPRVYYPGPR